jgi:hypothetical protein
VWKLLAGKIIRYDFTLVHSKFSSYRPTIWKQPAQVTFMLWFHSWAFWIFKVVHYEHSILMITAFWDVTLCSLGDYWCFRGPCYFSFRVEEYATHSSEILVKFTSLHDITSHKIKILTVTAMKTPNLTFSAEMFNLKTIGKLYIISVMHSDFSIWISAIQKQQKAVCIVNCGAFCCQFSLMIKLKFSWQWSKLNSSP